MITKINQIQSISGDNLLQNNSKIQDKETGMFESVLRSAIDNVKNTESEAVKAQYLMATGQLDNPALLSIAQTKSAIAVDMLIQLRNRSLDAYSELTRINL